MGGFYRISAPRPTALGGPGPDGPQITRAAAPRERAHGRIAHRKGPRYVEIIDGFPMAVTGKTRKSLTREATA